MKNAGEVQASTIAEFAIWLSITVAVFCLFCYVLFTDKSKIVVVPEFTVQMASIPIQFVPVSDHLNMTLGYRIVGDWKLELGVKNPSDKHVLNYSDVDVHIYYGTRGIWSAEGHIRQFSIWWDKYEIPGFNQRSDHLDAISVKNTTRLIPLVSYLFRGIVLEEWINSKSTDFRLLLGGWVMPKKGKEDGEEKWQELRVYCDLVVEFNVTAAGLMTVAATPSSCHTSLDGWWYT